MLCIWNTRKGSRREEKVIAQQLPKKKEVGKLWEPNKGSEIEIRCGSFSGIAHCSFLLLPCSASLNTSLKG